MTAVYRDFDAETLEYEYSPRAFTPDAAEQSAKGTAMSAAFRDRARNAHLNIAFGPSAEETLDLFLPDNPAGAPVEVYIHGGYWRARHKDDYSYMAEPVVEAGGICAVVNYALCPDVTLDEIVRQCRAATAWTYRNIANYGGNPNRLHVAGHSAGGHLCAMVAATDWPAFDPNIPDIVLKSACALSGIYDLTPIRLVSVQDAVQLSEEDATRNSPVELPSPNGFPMAVAVGTKESNEFRRQSQIYAEYLEANGVDVTFFEMPGKTHSSMLTESLEPGNRVSATRLQLMGLS